MVIEFALAEALMGVPAEEPNVPDNPAELEQEHIEVDQENTGVEKK